MRTARRNTELGLLLMAALVIVGAYMLVSMAEQRAVPINAIFFLGLILGIQVIGHLALRRYAPYADATLWPIASLLNGLGFVIIARLDDTTPELEDELEERTGFLGTLAEFTGNAGQQAMWVIIGLAIFVLTLAFVKEAKQLERYRYTAGFAGLLLVALPLVPGLGREINGARVWVSFGPINFQPGEFAKLFLALFFAAYLFEKREMLALSRKLGPVSVPDPKYLGPLGLAWAVSMGLMLLQNELGTSLLLFGLFTVLIWVATERTSYLVICLSAFFLGAWFAVSNFLHAAQRIELWPGLPRPACDGDGPSWLGGCGFQGDLMTPTNEGLNQLDQGTLAQAEGGLTGVGLGMGSPELVQEVETDFILTAIAEELGLFGTTAILLGFLLIIGTGLRIAQQQTSSGFDRLLAVGLTTLIGLQTFVIVAGVTQLLPLTGITLPFVSYGGSSLLANYVLVALLLRMSDSASRRQEEEANAAEMTTVGTM
jgi:cell division protein FtsW (lipid II flippase)